jgi:branched-chain amino acid transport system substrate-binding protein
MRKGLLFGVGVLAVILAFSPSVWGQAKTIKIGINAELTGDVPKIGEGTKFAAQMWLDDVKAAGGIEVQGKKYRVELIIEDNESKAESAVQANTKMITVDDVLVIVGPQASKQAVPAGGTANRFRTPMISPWSTNRKPPRTGPMSSALPSLIQSGPGRGQFRYGGVQIHEGSGALRCGERLPQGPAEYFKRPGKRCMAPVPSSRSKASPPRIPTSVPS